MTLSQFLEMDAALSARLRVAEKPGPLRTLAALLAHSGDSWFWGVALALTWWSGDGPWKVRALVISAGIVTSAVLVQIMKLIFRRRRPEGAWGQIYRKTDPHSFPSGHAARAILLAVLGLFLGPPWLSVALLIWGPLVALARVAMGVHYVSDIAVGAVVGGGIGFAIEYLVL